jgi:hypothetical protein
MEAGINAIICEILSPRKLKIKLGLLTQIAANL